MDKSAPEESPGRVLIAGCGYLGHCLGITLQALGWNIVGLSRSIETVHSLQQQGWEALAIDFSDPVSCRILADHQFDAVIHCAASGKGGGEEAYAKVYRDGATNLIANCPTARFIFTSSTSVYPQIDGSIVTEESPAEPPRGTGKILRESESIVLQSGGTVVRLAGIYGPGRSVLLKNFLTGASLIDTRTQPPVTPDGRWINQIHRQDAAHAIAYLLGQSRELSIGQIYNVTDSAPLTQRSVYETLAQRFDRPLPPEAAPDETRKRGWTHKQVSNAKLLATGWQPLYPHYFSAFENDPEFLPSILSSLHDAPA